MENTGEKLGGRNINVLSLFDGISCGMVALERTGIKVDEYHAFEIDKYAIEISKKNYPNIIHHGDVYKADFKQFKGIDIVIGGSPCAHWSIAKKERETNSNGIGFDLFKQFVRAVNDSGCKYFLYENNHSIHNDIKTEISKYLGVEHIIINSSLVSGQQRKRCYWTNIPGVEQPEDKGINVKDILESEMVSFEKTYSLINKPICLNGKSGRNGIDGLQPSLQDRIYSVNGKSTTITAAFNPNIAVPIRLGDIEGSISKGQGGRVYSVFGKSVCLSANGGGGGAKTGLYKIDLPDGDYLIRKLTPVEAERLQTLPDNYTDGVSNSQRYKGIGNGWTVDVIAHIFKGLKSEVTNETL